MIQSYIRLSNVFLFAFCCLLLNSTCWGQDKHAAEQSTSQFDLHPELGVELFAAEPMMANPTNIDVDHLGRVWVCEVLNYRHFRNKDATPRPEGDRILILEDTNGDAVADRSTVFYQGKDRSSKVKRHGTKKNTKNQCSSPISLL